MLCPSCKTYLKVIGRGRLEGIEWHVCHPNYTPPLADKYGCLNDSCETKGVCFWNKEGELFVNDYSAYKNIKKDCFIDGNDAPFGTISRKIRVEVYKDDENFDLFTFGKYIVRVKYSYQSNNDGDILKRKRKLELWRKTDDGVSTILVTNPFKMIWFQIKRFHQARGSYLKDNNHFYMREMNKYCDELKDWEKEDWWRRVTYYYCHMFNKLFPVRK